MFVHARWLAREYEAIRLVYKLHGPSSEWDFMLRPGAGAVGRVIERRSTQHPGTVGIREEGTIERGHTWHGNVVPGETAIIRSQEIGVAQCPTIECINHLQTSNYWRRDNCPWDG